MNRKEALELAASLGHTVENDPPSGMSTAYRWKCTSRQCGRAVIDYQGNLYGSALLIPCVREEILVKE